MTTADAVVVGAGIAGASAAWALSASMDVLLVEREAQPGHHATGRSASVLSETSGTAITCAFAAASRPFLESPPDGFTDQPLLSPRGLVWVGTSDDTGALDALAAAGAAVRPTVRRLDPAEVARAVPILRPGWTIAGGVHEPDAMAIDVDALLQGFLRGVRRRGGRITTGAEVLRAERARGGWRVHLPEGVVHARHLVDAAGAWGDDIARRCGVAPLGLRVLRRTACLVPGGDTDVSGLPLVMDVGGRFYLEPESGGLLLSPADETPCEPCDATAEEMDVALALERVAEATTLTPRHVRRAWAGLRTFTSDRSPVAGFDAIAPGFVWLVGQGGAGIKTAPAMAMAAAALLTGSDLLPGTPPLADLSPNRR